MKVLVADDERKVASALNEMLSSLGYEVVATVDDGQKAVEMSRRAQPDVVLLDINMPVLDGLSAARQIVREPGIPVIILTAHGEPDLVEQAIQDGVVQYLLKPVTGPALHAAIQTSLENVRKIREWKAKSEQLEVTLKERKLIERAKGILMNRRGLTEPEAFRLLQRQSQDRRMPMVKLAESIVQADEMFGADA